MKSLKIIGTGSVVPSKVVTNDDMSRYLDTSDAWIQERTGIKSRRFVEGRTSTSDLGAIALRNACDDAGIDPSELDGIILGTCSPDAIFPSTACRVQEALGITGMPAFDVMAGCSSFLYGLEVASHWIGAHSGKKIAVIGAEVFSKLLDFSDRRTCVLFGDGAGAAIVTSGDGGDSGVLASNWGSDGTLAEILQVPAGGSRLPATHATVDEHQHFVVMEGAKVFKNAVRSMSSALIRALADAEVPHDKVDVLIPHQANLRIMEACRERTDIPRDRVYSVLDKYGNISAASIPVAMDEAKKSGVLCDGRILAMTAFGAGLTWGATVMRW